MVEKGPCVVFHFSILVCDIIDLGSSNQLLKLFLRSNIRVEENG